MSVRPFNLKRYSQRQEGTPNAWQQDFDRNNPYRKRKPGDGLGYDRTRAGSEGTEGGPGDIAESALGVNQRHGSPAGPYPSGIKQNEDLGDKDSGYYAIPGSKNENTDPFNKRDEKDSEGIGNHQNGEGKGIDTGYGLLQHGDDFGRTNNSGDGIGGRQENPLGIHETVGRMMSGTQDGKFPFANPPSHGNAADNIRRDRGITPKQPIWNEVRKNTSSSIFRLVKQNIT